LACKPKPSSIKRDALKRTPYVKHLFSFLYLHGRIDNAYEIAYHSMNLEGNKMHALTASEARANLYRIIDETAESHEPIIISGKRTSAVLLSAEDWSAIQETLYLLAVPGMRESIKAGMAEPLAKSAKALKW
jgi:antitoxin YefM